MSTAVLLLQCKTFANVLCMYNFALRLNLTSHEKGRTRRNQPRRPVLMPIAFPGLDWDAHPSIQLLAGDGIRSHTSHATSSHPPPFHSLGTTNMLVHDGVSEAKLFADLLSSLRATGEFSSAAAAAPVVSSPPTAAVAGSNRSEVEAAEAAMSVAAAETRAAAAEAKLAEAILQNARLSEQLAEVKLENARLRATRL